MSIAAFVTPVPGWQPPTPKKANPERQQTPPRPTNPDWQDYAAQERWAEAITSFLRADWRETFPLWTVINSIVAESHQQSRSDTRAATFEVLQEVMRLRRERVIFRFKRKWIAALDTGQPVIPFEELRRKLERERPTRVDSTPKHVFDKSAEPQV